MILTTNKMNSYSIDIGEGYSIDTSIVIAYILEWPSPISMVIVSEYYLYNT